MVGGKELHEIGYSTAKTEAFSHCWSKGCSPELDRVDEYEANNQVDSNSPTNSQLGL